MLAVNAAADCAKALWLTGKQTSLRYINSAAHGFAILRVALVQEKPSRNLLLVILHFPQN